MKNSDDSVLKTRFGKEYRVFGQPYRNRLLKLDLATMTWINLEATVGVLPRAQCFGAELHSGDETMKIVIGGGYGLIRDQQKADKKKIMISFAIWKKKNLKGV